jgi:hypothetical protein
MESEKKILGIIYIISAILQTMLIMAINLFVNTILDFALDQANPADAAYIQFAMRLLDFIPLLILIFLTLPSLIAGIGLLLKQEWGLTVAMIVGCLKLFSFPIGTAIGVFAIYIYFEDKKLNKTHSGSH